MVTSLLFEVNDILLTGTSPLALANSIYYLRAKITRHSKSVPSLSYGSPNPPRVPYHFCLFVCLFVFFDTIDRRLTPSIKDPTKKACQLYHAPKI